MSADQLALDVPPPITERTMVALRGPIPADVLNPLSVVLARIYGPDLVASTDGDWFLLTRRTEVTS